MPKKVLKWIGKIALGLTILALVVAAVLVADYFLFPVLAKPRDENFNRGLNGLWLGSKWYHGKVTDTEIGQIADRLKREQIVYGYFHCRDIKGDGALRHPEPKTAKRFVQMMHRLAPSVKVIAWIGAVNVASGGEVDLSKPDVKSKMASEAAWLVRECGYDGIQWDFEVCEDGNTNLFELMTLTRKALPQGTFLSVDAHPFWTSTYVAHLATVSDQVALMGYDTSAPSPRFYVWILRWLVENHCIAVAAANPKCSLMIGVPTYEDVTRTHNAHNESLLCAIIAVKDALARLKGQNSTIPGIAPYAEFTTDAQEWSVYEQYWLK